jgi:hypothetical protein
MRLHHLQDVTFCAMFRLGSYSNIIARTVNLLTLQVVGVSVLQAQ